MQRRKIQCDLVCESFHKRCALSPQRSLVMLRVRSRIFSVIRPLAFHHIISIRAAVQLFVQTRKRRLERRMEDGTRLPFFLLAVNVTYKFVSHQSPPFVPQVVSSFLSIT